MLKFFLKIGFTAAVAFLLQLYLPWWSVALAGFLISLILSSSGWTSFFSAFIAIFCYWGLMALLIDNANDQILSARIALILTLPSPALLIMITALIGGIVGGFGALTGSTLRNIVLPVPAN